MKLKCLLGLNLNLNVADFVQVGLGCLGGLVQMYLQGLGFQKKIFTPTIHSFSFVLFRDYFSLL
jgi:hypothetical protein